MEEIVSNATQVIEQQTCETRTEEAQNETLSLKNIMLFCHPRNIKNLVEAFEKEIEDAPQELPMCVRWSGISGLLHMGVVVLEWNGTITREFLYNLSIDHEIFDYVVYDQAFSPHDLSEILPTRS